MNMLQSISHFLKGRKKGAVAVERGPRKAMEVQPGTTDMEAPELEDSPTEGDLSEEVKEDIAFVRSSIRQSVKRALGLRKSQRKAINKRKKENIHNSKLLTGGGSQKEDEGDEYYEDVELDAVVVIEADGVPSAPSTGKASPTKNSRIPKRRNSTKRPAVSLKSSGFFSQSVASKKVEGVKPVTARKNKASELREEANKKKLESPPGITIVPPPPTARRKPRASFRTKKGLSRRPLHKKEIKPVENKASQLRAMKHQDDDPDQAPKPKPEPKPSGSNPRRSDRYPAVGIKTSAHSSDSKDPLAYLNTGRRGSAPSTAIKLSTSPSDYKIRSSRSDIDPLSTTGRTSGRATKAVPAKPARTKASSSSSSTASNIPTPSRTLPVTPSSNTSSSPGLEPETITRKFSGRSEKTPAISNNIPKRNFNPTQEPSKDLLFIPLDSVSLPLPGEKKIDDIKRKRKIHRPVSNIFDGGDGDLPTNYSNKKYQEYETNFPVHVNKIPTKVTASGKKTRTNRPPKTPVSSSVPVQHSPIQSLSQESNKNDCRTVQPKPRQLENISNFTRQNSIGSSGRSKKIRNPAVNKLSTSTSMNSEGSDQENTCSYDSCRSFDEDDDSLIKLATCPLMSESPRFRDGIKTPKSALISTDDLENQIQSLKTPRKRTGSIRIKKIKSRKSWLKCENPIAPDEDFEKVKNKLTSEALIMEDLMSGHDDITKTLSSRTLVLKNITAALRRSDTERAGRMTASLCFPRSHGPDEEFKTMRRACQCTSDDLALFQNCLTVLLVDRDTLTLPVVSILVSKIRVSFEILGSEGLRGSIGDLLKLIITNFGNKIVHRETTPGLNYRLYEHAEECFKELQNVKRHVEKLTTLDYSPELMALKKTLQLFDF